MKEYTREEINTLWKQAYYRVSGGQNGIGNLWVILALLLIPLALIGFPKDLFFLWLVFSGGVTGFALYIRTILEKSKQGEFSARNAIIRTLIFGVLGLSIIWMFFLLTPLSMGFSNATREKFLIVISITVVFHVATIPLGFIWSKGETQIILEGIEGIARSGLNMFGGWMQIYYWGAVLVLAVIMNLFFSIDISLRFLLVISLYADLMVFIFITRNMYLVWVLYKIGLENSPYQATLKEVKKQLKEEQKARRKRPMRTPVWCERCNAQGEIEVDDTEGNYYVICEVCGTETAEVWCDEGVGGQFVRNIHEHPLEFDCEICKKTHTLPADFYEKPVTLELIEEPRNKRK